ncbi:MAG TPA: helix-turn-helix domain-containing protein [Candidatus Thermoplasmatota archaeon]|nr:helix-turn-helix domain-containing protein [Candidatus Thermoplasmatota archaeon]
MVLSSAPSCVQALGSKDGPGQGASLPGRPPLPPLPKPILPTAPTLPADTADAPSSLDALPAAPDPAPTASQARAYAHAARAYAEGTSAQAASDPAPLETDDDVRPCDAPGDLEQQLVRRAEALARRVGVQFRMSQERSVADLCGEAREPGSTEKAPDASDELATAAETSPTVGLAPLASPSPASQADRNAAPGGPDADRAAGPTFLPSAASPAPPLAGPLPILVLLGALLLPAWLLYRRLCRNRALDQPTRRRILERLDESPGATAGALAAALAIDRDTAEHHLRVLRQFREVEERRVGARLRYFRTGRMGSEAERMARLATANPSTRRVLSVLARDPSAPLAVVAQRAGLPKSTARDHLRRLETLGLRTQGRLSPEAIDALAAHSKANW